MSDRIKESQDELIIDALKDELQVKYLTIDKLTVINQDLVQQLAETAFLKEEHEIYVENFKLLSNELLEKESENHNLKIKLKEADDTITNMINLQKKLDSLF